MTLRVRRDTILGSVYNYSSRFTFCNPHFEDGRVNPRLYVKNYFILPHLNVIYVVQKLKWDGLVIDNIIIRYKII